MRSCLPLALAALLGAGESSPPDVRPYVLSAETGGLLLEDCWPTLPLGPDRVEEIARKARNLPWAADLLDHLRDEAATLRRTAPVLPLEQTGWRHDFFSRSTGEALVFEAQQSDTFLVPSTGGREDLPAQHRAWVLLAHEHTARLMRGLGLLYRLDGRAEDAAWVLDGFRRQVAWWSDPAFGRDDGGLRARHHHVLYDASTLIVLADAWACVRERADAALRAQVEDGIFTERVPVFRRFLTERGAHNMSAYVAAALVRMGVAAGRPEWIAAGEDAACGLAAILLQGLPVVDGQRDGFWHEGTMFYHFYTLIALAGAAEATLAHQGRLEDGVARALGDMLHLPWRLSDHHLRLPPLGDLGDPRLMHLGAWRHLYEWAAGRLDPARFRPVLAAISAAGFPRRDLAALAYGPDDPGPAATPPSGDDLLPASGLGLLRGDGPDPAYVLLRGGRYVGGHDHPDRLNLILHVGDALLSPDLGEPGYGLRDAKNRSYHRSTAAHNTLFADEREQQGKALLTRRADGTLDAAITDRQGVVFRRSLRRIGHHLLVLDRWRAPQAVRCGWIHHGPGPGTLTVVTPTASPVLPRWPDAPGWNALAARQTQGASAWQVCWPAEDGLILAVQGVSDGAVELTLAEAPGNPFPRRQGALVLRLPGANRRVASVFTWSRSALPAVDLRLTDDGMEVGLEDGSRATLSGVP